MRAGVKKEKWLRDNPGQAVITAGQIMWTAECEKALADTDGAHKALRALKKKWVGYLGKLNALTRSRLTALERNKARRGLGLRGSQAAGAPTELLPGRAHWPHTAAPPCHPLLRLSRSSRSRCTRAT